MEAMSLNSEQTEKILQFQELTGVANLVACREVLERHDWDLELAVQEQLNISEGRPSVFASETSSTPPLVVSDALQQHVFFAPPSSYHYRWGGPLGYLVSFVFQFCYNTFTSVLKFAYSLLWRDTRRMVTDPVGDVLRFVQYFNETWGSTHPVFYQGSYSQVLNDAKRELRFLLIYLHQDNTQDSDNFARDCLTDSEVVSYINSEMLFWACNTRSEEGNRVGQTLRASSYPFLALILLREARMTIVGRFEGPVRGEELLSRLRAVVSSNENSLEMARSERIERSLTQSIRREQDLAYLESLRQDQEKERRKTEEEERKRREERERVESELEEERRREELRRLKVELAKEVPQEPEPSSPDQLSIVFKMPSGDRIERRFLRSHTLKDVYNYVLCHPCAPDRFEIATNFPKRVLECETDGEKSLVEAGLGRSEVLFVYNLDA